VWTLLRKQSATKTTLDCVVLFDSGNRKSVTRLRDYSKDDQKLIKGNYAVLADKTGQRKVLAETEFNAVLKYGIEGLTKTIVCPHCKAELLVKYLAEQERTYCEHCDEYIDEGETTTIYECSSCGEEFNREDSADGDSNRCPSCNKFGAISVEDACTSCGLETRRVNAVMCLKCNEYFHEGRDLIQNEIK